MGTEPRPPICAAPCVYGGQEQTRRRSNSDLGQMGACNQRVKREGERCWRHPPSPPSSTKGGGGG